MDIVSIYQQSKEALLDAGSQKEIDALLEKYPFYALAWAVKARQDQLQQPEKAASTRSAAAMFAPNRGALSDYLQPKTSVDVTALYKGIADQLAKTTSVAAPTPQAENKETSPEPRPKAITPEPEDGPAVKPEVNKTPDVKAPVPAALEVKAPPPVVEPVRPAPPPPTAKASPLDLKLQTLISVRTGMYLPMVDELKKELATFKTGLGVTVALPVAEVSGGPVPPTPIVPEYTPPPANIMLKADLSEVSPSSLSGSPVQEVHTTNQPVVEKKVAVASPEIEMPVTVAESNTEPESTGMQPIEKSDTGTELKPVTPPASQVAEEVIERPFGFPLADETGDLRDSLRKSLLDKIKKQIADEMAGHSSATPVLKADSPAAPPLAVTREQPRAETEAKATQPDIQELSGEESLRRFVAPPFGEVSIHTPGETKSVDSGVVVPEVATDKGEESTVVALTTKADEHIASASPEIPLPDHDTRRTAAGLDPTAKTSIEQVPLSLSGAAPEIRELARPVAPPSAEYTTDSVTPEGPLPNATESMQRFVLPDFNTKPVDIAIPPAEQDLSADAHVQEVAPESSPSMRRFKMPDFGVASLDASLQHEDPSPQAVLESVQEALPAETSESMQRFAIPEFGTEEQPSVKPDFVYPDRAQATHDGPVHEAAPEAETSESMQRFAMPEFATGEQPAYKPEFTYPSGTPESGVTQKHDAIQTAPAEPIVARTESMTRFVLPEFGRSSIRLGVSGQETVVAPGDPSADALQPAPRPSEPAPLPMPRADEPAQVVQALDASVSEARVSPPAKEVAESVPPAEPQTLIYRREDIQLEIVLRPDQLKLFTARLDELMKPAAAELPVAHEEPAAVQRTVEVVALPEPPAAPLLQAEAEVTPEAPKAPLAPESEVTDDALRVRFDLSQVPVKATETEAEQFDRLEGELIRQVMDEQTWQQLEHTFRNLDVVPEPSAPVPVGEHSVAKPPVVPVHEPAVPEVREIEYPEHGLLNPGEVEERIRTFRENLSRIHFRTRPRAAVDFKSIQSRFLNSVVEVMTGVTMPDTSAAESTDIPAFSADLPYESRDTGGLVAPTALSGEALNAGLTITPATAEETAAPPSSVDLLMQRYQQLEPVIAQQLAQNRAAAKEGTIPPSELPPTEQAPETDPNPEGAPVSETLAEIYAQQGKTQMALEVYDQLALKYPEKATYFAARVAALRAKD